MEIILFIILLIAIAGGFAYLTKTLKHLSVPQQDPQSLLLMQDRINELTRTLDARLGGNEKAIREQFGDSMKIVKDVQQELVKVNETNKRVVSAADELKTIQDILRNPKQRGVVGEYLLTTLLQNVFAPGQYEVQYKFKDGSIVDAIVKTDKGIVPVDSKFSMENYNRISTAADNAEKERYQTLLYNDLKLRIDETSKYIKPEENTLDFAFMFIPSEAVYYDLLTRTVGVRGDTDLIEYATNKKKVIVVSPTTFFAYLQTVIQGLRALHIEESAKKIGKNVGELGRHLSSYKEFAERIGKNLSTTVSAYNSSSKEFGKINKDLYRITNEEFNLELPIIDKPEDSDSGERLL